jgi:FkbM family methyltransferase
MEQSLLEVLGGEYDAPFYGAGLTILDVGANVGAFSVWADLRWPRSRIHAYEPHPGTFDMLVRNIGHLPNVHCEQVAVYPGGRATVPLISRYAGDGEAGVVDALVTTWRALPADRMIEVPTLAPDRLPPADIIKVDAEGSEAAIVEGLKLERASLLLVEYQNLDNLSRIMTATGGCFEIVRHDSHPWSALLGNRDYRPELRGDRYGTLVLARVRSSHLRRGAALTASPPAPTGLRAALRPLPRIATGALRSRMRSLIRSAP